MANTVATPPSPCPRCLQPGNWAEVIGYIFHCPNTRIVDEQVVGQCLWPVPYYTEDSDLYPIRLPWVQNWKTAWNLPENPED